MTTLELQASIASHLRVPRPAAVAHRLETGTVVCDACGCRLTTRERDDGAVGGGRIWWHFAGGPGRDARGCTVGCVEAAHHLA